MIRALYSAASGMTAQQLNIDNIANNLANANTVGYKSRRAQFQDLMYQTLVQPGTQSGASTVVPTGLQLGLGVRAASNEIIFTQGDFSSTGNPLDMVIQGRGFFQIKQANGETAYTRAGSFQLDATGNIVTPTAIPSCRRSQSRQPPSPSPSRRDGTVSYTLPGQTAAQTAGQITLANFQNPAGLNSIGQSLLSPHRCFRRGAGRSSRRHGRNRHHPAGLCRAIERQRGG